MFRASVFTCIITKVFNFTIVFIISLFMFKPFFANMTVNLIFSVLHSSFVYGIIFYFSMLIMFNACSLKDLQNFSCNFHLCIHHAFFLCHLYTSCLFSMSSNVHIVDIECLQGISSHTFVVDDFSGLFSDPSTSLIRDSRFA